MHLTQISSRCVTARPAAPCNLRLQVCTLLSREAGCFFDDGIATGLEIPGPGPGAGADDDEKFEARNGEKEEERVEVGNVTGKKQ